MKRILSKFLSLHQEFYTYGTKAAYFHILYMLTKNPDHKIKHLQQQDVAIRKMRHEKVVSLIKARYERIHNEKLDLDNPQTYNEKLQWLNAYDATPLKTRLADKYRVRAWVEEKTGSADILVPLLGVYNSVDEIDFDSLPNQFCIKTNHGCAMNYVVKDKSRLSKEDIAQIKVLVNRWMETPFYVQNMELHYRDIPRKILVEKYIEEMDGNLVDYKFFCFGGEPKFINVIGDRNLEKHTAKEGFCDMDWNRVDIMDIAYGAYQELPPKPVSFNKMKDICRILSNDFAFVRVDLYEIDGEVKFGEMTFTPGSGTEPWSDKEKHLLIGQMISLPANKFILQ